MTEIASIRIDRGKRVLVFLTGTTITISVERKHRGLWTRLGNVLVPSCGAFRLHEAIGKACELIDAAIEETSVEPTSELPGFEVQEAKP